MTASPTSERFSHQRSKGAAAPALHAAAHALLQALPLPCAVFERASGMPLASNDAFLREFGAQCARLSRRELEACFEGFEDFSGHGADTRADTDAAYHERFCPATQRWYALSWNTLDDAGCALELLSVSDLSEPMDALRRHRSLQEQLLFTSRTMSVGEMVTTLAHELNQPLAAIINYLGTAQCLLDAQGDARRRLPEALAMAREQAEQAAGVIARMREFVQRREPRRERLRLAELAAHVARLLQLEAQKHRVRIVLEINETLPPVLADRVMIEQVLANLLKNAIEAMRTTPPAQRVATISARRDADGRIAVRISDHGCGLPAGQGGELFTPFFTTKPEGMGVGLAICRSIVEFHQGSLYYEANADGGLSFVFTLPCASDGRA